MKDILVIPLIRVLQQYVDAHRLPFRLNRAEEIIRCFNHYNIHVAKLN